MPKTFFFCSFPLLCMHCQFCWCGTSSGTSAAGWTVCIHLKCACLNFVFYAFSSSFSPALKVKNVLHACKSDWVDMNSFLTTIHSRWYPSFECVAFFLGFQQKLILEVIDTKSLIVVFFIAVAVVIDIFVNIRRFHIRSHTLQSFWMCVKYTPLNWWLNQIRCALTQTHD